MYDWRNAKIRAHDISQKIVKWLEEDEKKPKEILSDANKTDNASWKDERAMLVSRLNEVLNEHGMTNVDFSKQIGIENINQVNFCLV